MQQHRPFHFAFSVRDLQEARHFYGQILGCSEGRSSDRWVDFNLYGHQIVAHLQSSGPDQLSQTKTNPVDGHPVPVPHCGVVLTIEEWKTMRDRLVQAGIEFVIQPYMRFQGEAGEQATLFFQDPS